MDNIEHPSKRLPESTLAPNHCFKNPGYRTEPYQKDLRTRVGQKLFVKSVSPRIHGEPRETLMVIFLPYVEYVASHSHQHFSQ